MPSISNQNNDRRENPLENHDKEPMDTSPSSQSASPPHSPPPPPLSQKFYARLQASLEPEALEIVQMREHQLLTEIGPLLRIWRTAHGYSRAQCATQMAMDAELLLWLEQGIAQPGDIDHAQLKKLRDLIGQEVQSESLAQLLTEYLML